MENYKSLYVCGDIHGEIRELTHNIVIQKKITESAIIVAGDIGLGFNKKEHWDNLYARIKSRLEKSGNTIYCVRGNHDDPDYWNYQTLDYPHLKLLQDYSTISLAGHNVLVIGGATSTDRTWRLEEEKKKGKKLYWIDERPYRVPEEKLPTGIDVVISHEAPIQFLPLLPTTLEPEVYIDTLRDREYLGEVLKVVNPKKWYFGHHHTSILDYYANIRYRGLDIQELEKVI